MDNKLTENQKNLLRWIVDKIRDKYLNEEFFVSWTKVGRGFLISDNQGKKGEFPESLTKSMLKALEEEGVIRCEPQYLPSRDKNKVEYKRDCTITQKAFELVDKNFQVSDISFKDILLEKEQKDLLCKLVEASRNLPQNKREGFKLSTDKNGDQILHTGLTNEHMKGYLHHDIKVLSEEGLLLLKLVSKDVYSFDILPKGFLYYQKIKEENGQPIERIEKTVLKYLNNEAFREKYKNAYQNWTEADQLLWQSDTKKQLTTIGHHCREAMQKFATILVEKYNPSEVDPDEKHTKNRLKSVIDSQSNHLGSTIRPFLNTIISYWDNVSDLVQRQEHGATIEGESLVWEDGRKIVFQTAVVMFEVDVALSMVCKSKP